MKRQLKRTVGFFLALMLIMGLMPRTGETAWAAVTDDNAAEVAGWDLSEGDHESYAVTKEGEVYTLKLLKNIEEKTPLSFGANSWTLDLNGYGIRMTGSGPVIVLSELTIKDSAPAKEHYIIVNENGRASGVKNDKPQSGAYFKVTGGYITGSDLADYESNAAVTMNHQAAAVTIDQQIGKSLKMEGGTIIGNAYDPSDPDSGKAGGGVYVTNKESGGTFTMTGGMICHNRARSGGGVYASSGNTGSFSFTMSGGKITDNTAEINGGGIDGSGVRISGGEITGNRAGSMGGGISSAPQVSGSPVIKDNFVGDNQSNVYIGTFALVISGKLGEEARIGVTYTGEYPENFLIKNGVTNKEDYTGQIFSDDEGRSVEFNGTSTVLTNNPIPKILITPIAKAGLTYSGEDLDIITPGEVNRGDLKLLYAGGDDDVNCPSDESFSAEVPKGKNAGDYYIWYRIEGYPEKGGVVKATIGPKDIRNADITFKYDLRENGKEQEQKIETVSLDGIFLKEEEDYTIDGSSEMKAASEGLYHVKINGKGNYTGTAGTDWRMGKADTSPEDTDSEIKYDELTDGLCPVPVLDKDKKVQAMNLVVGQKFTDEMLIGWTMDKHYKTYLSINKKKGSVMVKKAIEKIEIKSPDGEKTISVNICDPRISEKKIKMEAGGKASVSFNGKNSALPEHWVTDKPDVATVNDSGEITAVAKGKATITGYVCGKPFKCKVTVKESKAAENRTLHITMGEKAKKLPLKGVKNPDWKTVSANDADKIEIKKGKNIKGLKSGSVSLNAAGSGSASCKATVYVEDPTLKIDGIKSEGKNKYSLEMSEWKNKLIEFESVHQDVLFLSNNAEIVHDTGHGLLVPTKEGKAKLKAKINGKTVTITVTVKK